MGSPESTIRIFDLATGEERDLLSQGGGVGSLAWSPDGGSIAYTASFDPDNPDGTAAGPEDPPRVRAVRRIDYKQDNRGFLNDVRLQIWIATVATGERRMLTSDAVDHLYPSWSPDGTTLATDIPNRNGMHGQLGLVDIATGDVTLVGSVDGNLGNWAWSPSGDRLLLAADDTQSWQLDLYCYDVATKEYERLTDDLECQPDAGFATVAPPAQPVWIDDQHAVFHALRGRCERVVSGRCLDWCGRTPPGLGRDA